MRSLDRLMRPQSIAVIGGGGWCANVIRECEKIGFAGDIWAVHPTRSEVAGIKAYASIADLPSAPDAAFIGVNRDATVGIVEQLSKAGAGGAVCFASGFREASAELEDGNSLQDSLVAAAGDMPILGPNCYGFVNALDGAALWPDVHGAVPCATGVAFIGQSSNVAINISMQTRGLPLAYVVTCGNQAQIGMAEIGEALLSDPRVTALGLHIEGVNDLRAYEQLARTATRLGKPVVVMKVGASDQAQLATVSHTASLAGSDAGARALMRRLGFALADDPASFVETLKVLHVTGGLPSNRILSMSCSGGEASLMADLGQSLGVEYPPLGQAQKDALRAALGPKVALANPLDYHTYIWGDEAALTACFSAGMAGGDLALGCVVLDFPRQDRFDAPDWAKVVEAVIATRETSGRPMALLGSFAEGMPEAVSERLIQNGVVPLNGMSDGLKAIAAAAQVRPMTAEPLLLPNGAAGEGETLDESTAKAMLTEHGLRIPHSKRTMTAEAAAEAADVIGYPVVLKGMGFAHKTEAGAVRINLTSAADVRAAAEAVPSNDYLVEEMVTGAVAELLVGVLCDPVHGFVLTIGAGGVMTEILQDTVSLLLPSTREDIAEALTRLRCYPLLTGYRGKPAADIGAIVDAVIAVQSFVTAHQDRVQEIEINPLLCCRDKAIAVDALIRMGGPQ
ncbi:acetate--CoA ligase family protein [Marivivens aquimaris]|uniref:acetate--CoA ligase family protein n=1 Tax=Marivivens aquimaris TaxID=2774876 RepID=UPI0018823945